MSAQNPDRRDSDRPGVWKKDFLLVNGMVRLVVVLGILAVVGTVYLLQRL